MGSEDDWQEHAACRSDGASEADRQRIAKLFYPTHTVEFDARAWMTYCGRCSERAPCLTWGIMEESHGTWGGLHEREVEWLRRTVADGVPIATVVHDALSKVERNELPVKIRRKKRRLKQQDHTARPFIEND